MKTNSFILRLLGGIVALCLFSTAEAGSPMWSFRPLTPTTLSVPSNDTANVQYQVTNQSTRTHALSMQSIQGITQLTTGLGVCGNPFILTGKASCTLSLQVNGSQLTQPISNGPIVCEQGSTLQCYRPASANLLAITQAAAITDATITVTGSPLTLTTTGSTGTLTINNTSLIVAATNITSNFTGTALYGNVSETGPCASSVAPQTSCTITYTAGSTAVGQTNFSIQGSNTNEVIAAIRIDTGFTLSSVSPASGAASGGTLVTLTGTGLSGATRVTFNGADATGITVLSSTTVYAVTPVNAAGPPVDVVITTPSGSATLINGYTYQTTAVGQPAYGGTIACLNGDLNNLIAAPVDNYNYGRIIWTPTNTTTTTNNTNGEENTIGIVNQYGTSDYAAHVCSDYQVDQFGNSPCQIGNICYQDWFLPAGNNTTTSGQLNCLYLNRGRIGGFKTSGNPFYWSSTQANAIDAYAQNFTDGSQPAQNKTFSTQFLRCVRSFTP